MALLDLNPQQETAASHRSGPLMIIAGAGSGKTHALTSHLAALIKSGVPPREIVAITFTNKAAREMVERVRGRVGSLISEAFVGTFHSFGLRLLRENAARLNRTVFVTVYDDDDSLSLVKKILKAMNLSRDQFNPIRIHAHLGRVKNELLAPEEILDEVEQEVFAEYERALIASNAFDFDDLIQKVVVLFNRHPELRARYQARFRHILVDEFQDVNPAQYQLVKLLAAEHRNLSVVGDDSQAIYGFRGADLRTFLDFERDWPETKIVKLEQNYRSSGTIIQAASNLISHNRLQKPKELWTDNPDGSLITVASARDAEAEAEWIAATLMHASEDAGTVGVLYRTNAQSRAIEQALIVAGIPYRIFGGPTFYARKEIKDLVAGLRLAYNPRDSVSADRLAKAFPKKIAGLLIEKLAASGEKASISSILSLFLETTDYLDHLERKFANASERVENVTEFLAFAGGFATLHEFLERVSLLEAHDGGRGAARGGAEGPRVQLMTIHLAKGLEFDRVVIAGVAEGLLPHHRAYRASEELEEERRLMYVAMTRAKRELVVSFYGIPSRFLYEIPPELTKFESEGSRRLQLPDEDEMYIE